MAWINHKSTARKNNKVKMALIVTLVVGISSLHYGTDQRPSLPAHFLPGALLFADRPGSILVWVARGVGDIFDHYRTFRSLHADPLAEPFSRRFQPRHGQTSLQYRGSNSGGINGPGESQHERMLEAENLAGMGKAVAGVAHDMKTPLIAIGGFSRIFLQQRFPWALFAV